MIADMMKRAIRRLGPAPVDARFLQGAGAHQFTLGELLKRPRDQNESIIRSLCFGAYLGDNTTLCRVLGRYKMLVDTQDMGISVHLMGKGYWEMWHTEAMMRLLRPGMKAVDIGANLGYFSMMMSDIVGEHGSVHAFEPNPAIADRMRKSLAMNSFASRATVHEIALGDKAGTGRMAIPENQPRNGHVIVKKAERSEGDVAIERFDAMPELADADYIKIDVEGAEQAVWRGMAGLIASGRPLTIVLEFTPGRYVDAGAFLDDLLSGGFSLCVIDPWRGVVPISREAVLAGPPAEDQLLVLRR